MKEKQTKENPLSEVKIVYEKPSIEVIEMAMEGILCASDVNGTGNSFEDGGGLEN